MATLHFRNARVYMGGSGVAVQVAEAADVNIDVDFDTDQDNAFGDSWQTELKGLLKFNGSFSGNYDTAQNGNVLWAAATATGSVPLYVYPDASSATAYYYGSVFPKVSIKGSVSSKGTVSVSFQGNGQLAIN